MAIVFRKVNLFRVGENLLELNIFLSDVDIVGIKSISELYRPSLQRNEICVRLLE